MKLIEAINTIDALKPNAFPMAEKIRWLSRLDSEIRKNIIDTHQLTPEEYEARKAELDEAGEEYTEPVQLAAFTGYTVDTDGDTELIVPAPYDEIYVLYLEAQIDYYNGETEYFNNSNAMYSKAYQEFRNYYNSTHMPKQHTKIYF